MKIIKSILFYLIQFIACMTILEVVCYFFLMHSNNPLYRARKILRYDSVVGWIQKPALNTMFEKQEVFTDETGFRILKSSSPDDVFKFITLGPSSAFGWGVSAEETYSALVADHYQVKNLNASGIGHSIIQGNLVWSKKLIGKNLSLSHAFIAYGINDLDKFRFFDSAPIDDKTYFQSTPKALEIDKYHYPLDMAVVASLMTRQILYKRSCEQLIHSVQRVSWEDYEKTLSEMISVLKNKKITPIIINTPFYLKNKNPHYNKKLIDNSYQEVTQLAQSGKCDEARSKLLMAKSLEPDNILEQVILFNKHLKDYAAKNDLKYIDAYNILADGNIAENFIDPVHPSKLGHQKIASQIIGSMVY